MAKSHHRGLATVRSRFRWRRSTGHAVLRHLEGYGLRHLAQKDREGTWVLTEGSWWLE